jgi:hypothetical protein
MGIEIEGLKDGGGLKDGKVEGWISVMPAQAGIQLQLVMPAQAGIQDVVRAYEPGFQPSLERRRLRWSDGDGVFLGSSLRWNDGEGSGTTGVPSISQSFNPSIFPPSPQQTY